MKSLSLTAILLWSISSQAQSFFRYCNFDQPGWNYSIDTSSGHAEIESGMAVKPANSTIGYDSSSALVSFGGTSIIEFEPVDLRGKAFSYLTLKIAALGGAGSKAGMDVSSDRLVVEIRPDTTSSWQDIATVKGFNRALWSMDDKSLCFDVAYPNDEEFIPFDGGTLDAAVPGSIRIENLPQGRNVGIRMVMISDDPDEIWSIDEVGLHCPLHWTGLAGDNNAKNPLNWWPQATPDSTTSVWISDTSTALPFNDTIHVSRLITSAADTLNLMTPAINIHSGWLHLEGSVQCSTNITMESTPLGSAEIRLGSGMIFGDLKMRRKIDGIPGWRHVSVPLSTTWGDVSEDCTLVQFAPDSTGSIWQFDADQAHWVGVSGPLSPTSGRPVSLYTGPAWVTLPSIWEIEGRLTLQGDTIALQYGIPDSNGPFDVVAGNEGWNFEGNPFPFALDWRTITEDPDFPSILGPTVYVWNAGISDYMSYNPATDGVNGGHPYIAPWQAFWVQMTRDTTATEVSWLLKAGHGAPSNATPSYKNQALVKKSALSLSQDAGTCSVGLVLMPGALPKWDVRYDHRFLSAATPAMYISVPEGNTGDSARCALKAIDPGYQQALPIFVAPSNSGGGAAVFSLDRAESDWWLEDKWNGIITHLNHRDYTCAINRANVNRFLLWPVDPATVELGEYGVSKSVKLPIRNGNQWQMPDGKATWYLIDVHGRVIHRALPNEVWPAAKLSPGIYIWRSGQNAVLKWIKNR